MIKRSRGLQAFRRPVSDASLGMCAPVLGHKAKRSFTNLTRADRCLASRQIHHGCGCQLAARSRISEQLAGGLTGEPMDRDINAAGEDH